MKYGIVCTSHTSNLGDDIQSLAAVHLLRKNGITDYVCVEREELDSYSGEPVALITNGWFLHNFQNFPPSNKIKPLFIGFYCHHPRLIEKHQKYFKKHEPIGCRSASTVWACQEHGIEAYLSGCLTMGFDEVSHTSNGLRARRRALEVKHKKTPPAREGFYRTIPTPNYTQKSHRGLMAVKEPSVCVVDPDFGGKWLKWSRALEGHAKTLGENLMYFTHEKSGIVGLPHAERLDIAQSFLHMYGGASLVVTSRLHCVLPCRALNTPAKFIHPNIYHDPRFKGLQTVLCGRTPDANWNDILSRVDIGKKKISLDKSFRELLDRA